MSLTDWSRVPAERMSELVTRQMFHTARMTVSRLTLRRGALVPMHYHPNEQISIIEKGTVRFRLGDDTIEVRAGQMLVIPSEAPHSAEALEDSVAIDLFSPPREDWVRGDDAYLRGR